MLDTYWTGVFRLDPSTGLQIPVEQEYSFCTAPELSLAEWWEVPRSSKLGRKLRLYYPWVTPIVDEAGELTDVELQREAPDGEQLARKGARERAAARRGYRAAGRGGPRTNMPLLANWKESVV